MKQISKAWLMPLTGLLLSAVPGLALSQASPPQAAAPAIGADIAWMLTATGLVLLMTPGLSFFYGGMVQRKNLVSTMLQSFIAMGVVSLVWVVVGFSLSFGDSIGGVIGNPLSYFMFGGVGAETDPGLSPTIPLALFAMFQMKFAIITPALITGAFAERVRFSAYVLFLVLFSVFIYAPLAHSTWHPDGCCASGACSTSPAERSCTCLRGSRRSPVRSRSAAAAFTGKSATTRRPTFRTCCSAQACSGSVGSGSTAAPR